MAKYKVIGMGGTFDHLHAGHQEFLRFAAKIADEIWVGITTDMFTKHKDFAATIEDYETRQIHVQQFLKQENIKSRIFPLSDPCGPTLQGSPVEAIVVTDVTKQGGEFINQCRVNLNLPALPIEICELLRDETGEHISSTRIRQGIISRTGKVYSRAVEKGIILDTKQKQFFKDKHGNIVLAPTSASLFTYVVGDMVLETFLLNHWPYHLGVFDGFNQRQMYPAPNLSQVIHDKAAKNPAGEITKELVEHLMKCLAQILNPGENNISLPLHLRVDGEEDLAAVVLGLIAPLGSVVYYGQPNEGIIEMAVTEELKTKFYQTLNSQQPLSTDALTSLPGAVGGK